MTSPAPAGRSRTAALLALAAYLLFLAVALLAPTSHVQSSTLRRTAVWLDRLGVPASLLTTERVEFVANILLVVPAVALAAWIWRSVSWTAWTTYAFLGSVAVEAFQGVVWPERSATFADVVANTLGGLIGAAGCAVVLALTRRHQL